MRGWKLISIPRDSYVEVPGFGMDKINAAFTYGGPQLLTETVELRVWEFNASALLPR